MVSEKIVHALVICNLGHPTPVGGRGIALEMSGGMTEIFPWQCGGNTGGLLYIGKKCSEMKRLQAVGDTSSGFTIEQSLQGGTFSGDLLDQKSVPAISWGWRAVVTNG